MVHSEMYVARIFVNEECYVLLERTCPVSLYYALRDAAIIGPMRLLFREDDPYSAVELPPNRLCLKLISSKVRA